MGTGDEANSISASTFQKPLKQLAEVLAQKLSGRLPGAFPLHALCVSICMS